MNPTLKKKFPLIIFLVIVIGIVFFLSNNRQEDSVSTFGFGFRNENKSWPSNLNDPGNNNGTSTAPVTAASAVGYNTDGAIVYPESSSGTCYKVISNPDQVYTGTVPSNIAYPLDTDNTKSTNSLYALGPDSSKSEYGLFNAIMRSNRLITAFMNNNHQWIPYSISVIPSTTGTNFRPGLLDKSFPNNVLYSYVNTPTTGALTLSTMPATTSLSMVWGNGNILTCSINQALYIPSTTGATPITTVGGGNFGQTQRTITTSTSNPTGTTVMQNPQKYRARLILGVLVANHMVLNNSPPTASTTPGSPAVNSIPTGGNFTDESKITETVNGKTYYGLLADLYKNYSPVNFSATAPSTWNTNIAPWPGVDKTANTGYNLTYNSLHAVFLYVLARDAWLGDMISNILKI